MGTLTAKVSAVVAMLVAGPALGPHLAGEGSEA
jgi:hypothetical protein